MTAALETVVVGILVAERLRYFNIRTAEGIELKTNHSPPSVTENHKSSNLLSSKDEMLNRRHTTAAIQGIADWKAP